VAEIKTQRTALSVDAYLEGIPDEERRRDCETLLAMMRRVTGAEPEVWSSGVVGFGTFHYKSRSGQEGDWFPVGFASRKPNLTVYLGLGLEAAEPLLPTLGKYKPGKGCIYIRRLSEVDLAVLEEIVVRSLARIREMYGS